MSRRVYYPGVSSVHSLPLLCDEQVGLFGEPLCSFSTECFMSHLKSDE